MNNRSKLWPKAILVYNGLPVTQGGAHSLRRLSPERVLACLNDFLDTCTTQAELRCALQLLSNQRLGNRRKAVKFFKRQSRNDADAALFERARKTFGDPEKQTLVAGSRYDRVDQFSWTLSVSELPESVKWVEENPVSELPNLGVALLTRIRGRFKIRDPRSGEILPNQDAELYGNQDWDGWHHLLGESYLNVAISRASTWGLIMSLPFEDLTDEAAELIDAIEAHLPFRFSRKTWRHWVLNKTGTRYYQRKLDG